MQAVYNIAEICHRHGITDVILSPGSRSAPLTLAFARHPAYRGRLRVVPDERAAAFIALGIAQATRRPVVLVCTSGTAGLNYAPAVAEAYFQQIPLLILTADRPPEWIDQLDGQTIRQRNLYGAHAKGAFDFPADTAHPDAKWHSERIINEAINLTMAGPAGPVQVNVPLREPFYPKAGEEMGYEADVRIIQQDAATYAGTKRQTYQQLKDAKRLLVVVGQHPAEAKLTAALTRFAAVFGVPVVCDVISNVANPVPLQESVTSSPYFPDSSSLCPLPAEQFVTQHDIFLAGLSTAQKEELRPDFLITCGQSLISKSLKLFLREAKPTQHWHIQAEGAVADTFRTLTRIVRSDPTEFFSRWTPAELPARDTLLPWQQAEAAATQSLTSFFETESHPFNEFSAMRQALTLLPEATALHLANSMAVRYANILGLPQQRQVKVFANRGTSGIDGCTSTAVGAALAQPGRPVVLLTGDVAFFYDRNAFWHNYPTPNLRVVLFNNHGGGIFRLIDGPRQQPELDEFFETTQALTAENTARDFKLRYFPVSSFDELDAALPVFFAAETGAAILEIFTDSKTNAAFFEEYRKAVKLAFS
ncbi:2-succinyl-5-enolpyruvyl-6-hydroxy-3-cyclohexene-1-carboxylic-acid synthase [Hymenobacter sp. ASUV-10]|uniref:2-succinyl-5-enolpyruvyl-6-hydroxy-3-cyclohexene-1-carboxylate synthase n=1 Tax=Hymenobacter aranciens TaxID=3063996 RepID=A0ABT9BEN9_9BACT|nr:2-succinyl-5-enolpyruvyl-6-hydroxy-3-cyclohexene-1-carboxylic-acid synthase [Hymenobacter sp. ASUV-10]MDO7876144.1 2-succinyl-5-enolpyruvyl-6-hydroxy-3-cyclohexene-1-carboxylic-acid synthase [Hymenobacter sp. ASUV-10]